MLSSSHRVAVVLPLVSLVSLLAACGGGGGEQPAATPASITAVEPPGGTLSAVVGSPVAVRVRVADAQGNALRGVPVSWSTFAGGVSATSSTTDVGGVATTTWTLGPAAGTQSLSATAGSAPSLTFTATATADRAATVTIARDTTIALVPGARVRFTATVRDRYGNPASAIVRWSTSDVNVASIDSVGNFQAFNAGAVSVIAVADTARARSPP
ncbi:hypothetical protein J421_2463 [Gemmatirosa kalamazoonensis]|uniref:Uncharacterized protein n=1 Tax=Gemmatirosa kalamazoonensis TaxID=861299 RepID=W0RI40_9BACT|nr:Ig-like domain-containing protein [Gemmatirosa kalamazoonensis]AHG90000.1 hypothetical protein J421_2463 [Gemmatirosa kalamazoonensis]